MMFYFVKCKHCGKNISFQHELNPELLGVRKSVAYMMGGCPTDLVKRLSCGNLHHIEEYDVRDWYEDFKAEEAAAEKRYFALYGKESPRRRTHPSPFF